MRQLVSSSDKKVGEKRRPSNAKALSSGSNAKKIKDGSTTADHNTNSHISMIPKLKLQKNEGKGIRKKKAFSSPPKISSESLSTENSQPERKLLEGRAKSMAENYTKIEAIIQKVLENSNKTQKHQIYSDLPFARNVTSDTLVFDKGKIKNDVFGNFNFNAQDISEVWLEGSTDISNAFEVLESVPPSTVTSVDPIENEIINEIEQVKRNLGPKQARSLTLVKTRNLIAEAKELMLHRKLIRMEIEELINSKKEEVPTTKNVEEEEEEKAWVRGMGESFDGTDVSTHGPEEQFASFALLKNIKLPTTYNTSRFIESKVKSLESVPQRSLPITITQSTSTQGLVDFGAAEIAKKNETITYLNNKIFELQKTCNESSGKCNQLQVKLAEFREKIQWNQVLWKQIGKLKDRIKGLQENNGQFELEKKELESKISKLDQELERVTKLNQILNRKKYVSFEGSSWESAEKEKSCLRRPKNLREEVEEEKKILSEKQNMVGQLKAMLDLMKKQEDVAQRQISVFKSKIEEFEKIKKS